MLNLPGKTCVGRSSPGEDAVQVATGELERDTERLLRGARERADLVVFASAGKLNAPIFQQPLRAIVAARATKVRERQRTVASDLDVPFIDIAREVSPAYDDAAPESSSSDRFHPSDLGYEIWARPLAATVARAVESQ